MSAQPFVWESLGLPRVINAAGKMTYLGSSTLHSAAAAAMAAAAAEPVDVAQLIARADLRAAGLARAPAAAITSSAAAGIAQSVAAAIVGGDAALVETVPAVSTTRRRVILQKAHSVNFGAPIAQMIRVGGGIPVEVGSANRSNAAHLAAAMDADTAALVHVVSHHVQAESLASLPEAVGVAHEAGVPLIVDAAAETDLTRYLAVGADAVVYSGHKAIGGPTSGLVIGRTEFIGAVRAQLMGIGRAMKIGKETIAGFLAALERYDASESRIDELTACLAAIEHDIDPELPVDLAVQQDATRPIPRLILQLRPDGPLTARELIERLESGSPSIRTRNHDADRGRIAIDPRELSIDDAPAVAAALNAALSRKGSTP